MTKPISDAIPKHIKEIQRYCRIHKVEVNIDSDGGLSLWSRLDMSDITISGISPDGIVSAINSLDICRRAGWKSV